jgi:hypothetical protein
VELLLVVQAVLEEEAEYQHEPGVEVEGAKDLQREPPLLLLLLLLLLVLVMGRRGRTRTRPKERLIFPRHTSKPSARLTLR